MSGYFWNILKSMITDIFWSIQILTIITFVAISFNHFQWCTSVALCRNHPLLPIKYFTQHLGRNIIVLADVLSIFRSLVIVIDGSATKNVLLLWKQGISSANLPTAMHIPMSHSWQCLYGKWQLCKKYPTQQIWVLLNICGMSLQDITMITT